MALTMVWPCGVSCCPARMDALPGSLGPGSPGAVYEWVFAICLLFHPMGPGELSREGDQRTGFHTAASALRRDRAK